MGHGTDRRLRFLLTVCMVGAGVSVSDGAAGQAPDSASVVRGGVVEHETGTGLRGAAVSLTSLSGEESEPEFRSTGEEGRFLFEGVPSGLYRIQVSLMGYHQLQDTLRVVSGSELVLTLPLSTSPVRLEPIVVVSRRSPPGPIQGFERRRQRSVGTFLNRAEIEASNSQLFSDLLRRIPGVRIIPTGGFGTRLEFSRGCTPDLWVDGTLANTTRDVDSFLRPGSLEAVEVYQGANLPIEFGSNLCGAIVAWTRRGNSATDEAGQEKSLRRQLIFAGSLILLSALAIFLGH